MRLLPLLVAIATLTLSLTCLAQPYLPLSPTSTLELAMEKPLTLVGKYVSPSSSSGRIQACVFRNEDVTIIYEYCTKQESPATSVIIINHNDPGFSLQFYVEGTLPASRIRRDFYYDVFWRLSSRAVPAGFSTTTTAREMRGLEDSIQSAPGCAVFFMEGEGMGLFKRCADNVDPVTAETWLTEGEAFWNEPPETLYNFIRHMVGVVSAL